MTSYNITTAYGGTSYAHQCSHCGQTLSTVWFDYGNGQRLCGLCQSRLDNRRPVDNSILPSPVFPPFSATHQAALDEIVQLNKDLRAANEKITKLEAKLHGVRNVLDEDADA
jgi:recombinational DNA repair protein (RecF pathway)